jgi:hypothetical protein
VVTKVRLPAIDCASSPPVPSGVNPFPSFNTFHECMASWTGLDYVR